MYNKFAHESNWDKLFVMCVYNVYRERQRRDETTRDKVNTAPYMRVLRKIVSPLRLLRWSGWRNVKIALCRCARAFARRTRLAPTKIDVLSITRVRTQSTKHNIRATNTHARILTHSLSFTHTTLRKPCTPRSRKDKMYLIFSTRWRGRRQRRRCVVSCQSSSSITTRYTLTRSLSLSPPLSLSLSLVPACYIVYMHTRKVSRFYIFTRRWRRRGVGRDTWKKGQCEIKHATNICIRHTDHLSLSLSLFERRGHRGRFVRTSTLCVVHIIHTHILE